MKKAKAGLITMFLILSLLTVPGVFAADDGSAADSTDPDPSNNQASVTVNPTSSNNDTPSNTPERTIPMLPTGTPIGGIIFSILMVLAGFLLPIRNS